MRLHTALLNLSLTLSVLFSVSCRKQIVSAAKADDELTCFSNEGGFAKLNSLETLKTQQEEAAMKACDKWGEKDFQPGKEGALFIVREGELGANAVFAKNTTDQPWKLNKADCVSITKRILACDEGNEKTYGGSVQNFNSKWTSRPVKCERTIAGLGVGCKDFKETDPY